MGSFVRKWGLALRDGFVRRTRVGESGSGFVRPPRGIQTGRDGFVRRISIAQGRSVGSFASFQRLSWTPYAANLAGLGSFCDSGPIAPHLHDCQSGRVGFVCSLIKRIPIPIAGGRPRTTRYACINVGTYARTHFRLIAPPFSLAGHAGLPSSRAGPPARHLDRIAKDSRGDNAPFTILPYFCKKANRLDFFKTSLLQQHACTSNSSTGDFRFLCRRSSRILFYSRN